MSVSASRFLFTIFIIGLLVSTAIVYLKWTAALDERPQILADCEGSYKPPQNSNIQIGSTSFDVSAVNKRKFLVSCMSNAGFYYNLFSQCSINETMLECFTPSPNKIAAQPTSLHASR